MQVKKRSQITIFVIIGLIMLFIFIILFFSVENVNTLIRENKALPVKNFVDGCLELVGDKAIEWVLIQGGTYERGTYLDNPRVYKLAKPVEGGGIERNLFEFSEDSIEIGISNFFSDRFAACINDFTDFKIPIESGDSALFNATVSDKNIIFELNFPITIKAVDKEYNLEKFIYKRKIRMDKMIDVVNQIVDKSVELNDVPTDLINQILPDDVISLNIAVLDVDGAQNTIVYLLGFEDNKHIVGFTIEYNWI